jgi:predicted nucleic-acid-binding protein
MKALRLFKAGTADFAECLIERGASSAGCSRTMTFDVAEINADLDTREQWLQSSSPTPAR